MMDSIELGKPFQLFQPDRTYYTGHLGYISKVTLQVGSLMLPLTISAAPGNAHRMSALVPFRPELGYTLDSRDFTLPTREAKIQAEYDQPTPEGIFHSEAPLALALDTFNIPLVRRGGRLEFPEGSKIKNILFLLSVASMQVAARPQIWQPAYGRVDFSRFFPTDVGEDLPIRSTKKYDGFGLPNKFVVFLPNDVQKLVQLKGRFLFNEPVEPDES